MNTVDAATNRWMGILTAFGIDELYLTNKHGPCPLCGGKDRWRFDDKEGKGTWICSGCGSGNGIQLAMAFTGLSFKECANQIDAMIGSIPEGKEIQPKKDPLILLRKIQNGLLDPGGTIVEKYLISRGLGLPERGLYHHPKLPFYEDGVYKESLPAMVAIFRGPEGKPRSLHITYLNQDGTKRARKLMPPCIPLSGGSIHLSKPGKVLGLAEGIETALSGAKISEIPVWSCATAGLMEKWQPPEGVEEVLIYADNDANYCGQAAAYRLANRMVLKGLRAEVCVPSKIGEDWNDILQRL